MAVAFLSAPSSLMRLSIVALLLTIFAPFSNNHQRFFFASSLAAPKPNKGRRGVLSVLFSKSGGVLAAVSLLATTNPPLVAHAAIDVSGLRVDGANAGTTTDIFLGGSYVDKKTTATGSSTNQYTIGLSGTGFAGYRLVKVRVNNTRATSSSSGYELPGMIFSCPGGGSSGRESKQCITVDFSSVGGPRDTQGYWDEAEQGIRFVLENNVWTKQ